MKIKEIGSMLLNLPPSKSQTQSRRPSWSQGQEVANHLRYALIAVV